MESLSEYIEKQKEMSYKANYNLNIATVIADNIADMKAPSDKTLLRRISTCTSPATNYDIISLEGADRVHAMLYQAKLYANNFDTSDTIKSKLDKLMEKLERRTMGKNEYYTLKIIDPEDLVKELHQKALDDYIPF